MVRVTALLREVEIPVERLQRHIDDFTPFWGILIDNVLVNWIDQAFDTEGFGTWPPRADDLPHPLLQLTGELRRALTQVGSEANINIQKPDGLEYGSSIEYHIYHEEGTRHTSARPILGEILRQPGFEADVEREVEDYFQRIINGGAF